MATYVEVSGLRFGMRLLVSAGMSAMQANLPIPILTGSYRPTKMTRLRD